MVGGRATLEWEARVTIFDVENSMRAGLTPETEREAGSRSDRRRAQWTQCFGTVSTERSLGCEVRARCRVQDGDRL